MNEPPLECFDCIAAVSGVHYGFRSNCKGCAARAVARGPAYFHARQAVRGTEAGEQFRDDYRAILDRVGVTHDQVKAAHAVDAIHTSGGHVPAAAIPSFADPT